MQDDFDRNYSVDDRVITVLKNAENFYYEQKNLEDRISNERKNEWEFINSKKNFRKSYDNEKIIHEIPKKNEETFLKNYSVPIENNFKYLFLLNNRKNVKIKEDNYQEIPQELEEVTNKDLKNIFQKSKHCKACEFKYKKIQTTKQNTHIDINHVLLKARKYINESELSKAQDILKTTLLQGIEHSDLYYLLGEAYRLDGQINNAEENLLSSLTFDIHSPFSYYSLGVVYMNLGHFDKAIMLLNKFIGFRETEDALFNCGCCYAKLGEFIDSAKYYSKAIEIATNNYERPALSNDISPTKATKKLANYHLNRGLAYEAIGLFQLASHDFKTFKNLLPNYTKRFYSQIDNLEENGKFVEANKIRLFIKKLIEYY